MVFFADIIGIMGGMLIAYIDLNVDREVQKEIHRYYDKSLVFLNKLDIDEESRKELKMLADQLIKRDF